MASAADFAHSTCIVTGANRGIGLALVEALLGQGARVVAGVRHPKGAQALQALGKRHGHMLTVLPLDTGVDASVQAFAQALPAGAIDLLINNAGVNLDGQTDVNSVPSQVMLDTFNINTVGPLRLTQALLPRLEASGSPKVANISSAMGSIADNGQGGVVAYRTSKTALNMVTKCLALHNPKVVFLAMHPGWVLTDMGGSQAPVKTADSAAGLLREIKKADRQASGSFVRFDGKQAPW